MEWQERKFNESLCNTLISDGLYDVFARLLATREFGITNKHDIKRLLEPSLDILQPPQCLSDMNKTCDLLWHIKRGPVLIVGDYDVDGIASSYMSSLLLDNLGYGPIDVFLPDREEDGYGLNPNSIKHITERFKNKYVVVLVLDSGTSSFDEVGFLRKFYDPAELIIIDHHIANTDKASSNASCLINPRLTDAPPYCTGGIIYQVARAMNDYKRQPLGRMLIYAMMATIADVCDLTGDNRILVKHGLDKLSTVKDPGLKSLFKVAELPLSGCDAEDIAFGIAPMLNASGRLEIASKSLDLLNANDEATATHMAEGLKELNERRKELQAATFTEAVEMIGKKRAEDGILVYNQEWNPGIVGIVASKIVEKYGVPALCFGKSGGKIKGSARSVPGLNIKVAMDRCSHLFLAHGGHEMAAGATLHEHMVEVAPDEFAAAIRSVKEDFGFTEPSVEYDVVIDTRFMRRLNKDLCKRIRTLGPFGHGNANPVFRLNDAVCYGVKKWQSGKGGFVSINETKMDCYALSANVESLEGQKVDILFTIQKSFMDRKKWAIKIEHAKLSSEGE